MNLQIINKILKETLKNYSIQLNSSKCFEDNYSTQKLFGIKKDTNEKSKTELIIENENVVGILHEETKYLKEKIYNLKFQNYIDQINKLINDEKNNIKKIRETLNIKENKKNEEKIYIDKDLKNFNDFFEKYCVPEIERKLQIKSNSTINIKHKTFRNDNLFISTEKNGNITFETFWIKDLIKNVIKCSYNINTKNILDFEYKTESTLSNILGLENSYYCISKNNMSDKKILLNFGLKNIKELVSVYSLIKDINEIKEVLKLKEKDNVLYFDKELKKEDLEMISLYCEIDMPQSMSNKRYQLKNKKI